MQVRAEKIFPVLIPRLIASPITAFNARALASLVQVAGSALGRRLTNIVDALQKAQGSEKDETTLEALDDALSSVMSSVVDHDSGLGSLQMHMLSLSKSESPAKRVAGCNLFALFCRANEADFSDYFVDWIRQLISLFDDRASEVVGAAWTALDALVKTIDKEDLEPLVVPLRRTIENTGTPGTPVDGFSRPNGLKPILRQFFPFSSFVSNPDLALMQRFCFKDCSLVPENSESRLRTVLETSLNEHHRKRSRVIAFRPSDRSVSRSFPPFDPLLIAVIVRVIGDRFPAPVKSAILSTLTILLTRVPQFVKPFFPQLQRTFVKSLSDSGSSAVRGRGAAALGVLMQHQPRVDPLITELTNMVSTESGEVRDAVVGALANVVVSGGANLSEASLSAVIDVLSEAFSESNKGTHQFLLYRADVR